MFNTLLESRATRTRRTGGSLLSIVLHGTLIAAAVVVTGNAAISATVAAPLEELRFAKVEPPKPVLPPVTPDRVFTAASPPKGFQLLRAPIDIPEDLPELDLTARPTNVDDFSGRGVPNGRSSGVGLASVQPVPANGVYSDAQVEKPVVLVAGTGGPQYPEMLRAAGLEGQVLAQFVVDTLGRADVTTFSALRSDHPLFTAAVRAALSRMRFLPAQVGGRNVAQLVHQPFQFTVSR